MATRDQVSNAIKTTLRENPLIGWMFGKPSTKYDELAVLARQIYFDCVNKIQYTTFKPIPVIDAGITIVSPVQLAFAEKVATLSGEQMGLFIKWLRHFLSVNRAFNGNAADEVIQRLLQLRISVMDLTGDGVTINMGDCLQSWNEQWALHKVLRGDLDTKK